MSEPLSPADIEHVAELARLVVSAEEKEQLLGQLNDILDFVGQLQAVDTVGVEPLSHPTLGRPNPTQPDQATPSGLVLEELLSEAPDYDGRQVKVKAVFTDTEAA